MAKSVAALRGRASHTFTEGAEDGLLRRVMTELSSARFTIVAGCVGAATAASSSVDLERDADSVDIVDRNIVK
jgi:hypothetical protein